MSLFKFKLSDLKYFGEFFAPVIKSLKTKKKITNIQDLKDFVQKKSALYKMWIPKPPWDLPIANFDAPIILELEMRGSNSLKSH